LESKDYGGLIEYLENYTRLNPKDEYAKCRLGEAFILNGEYESALKYMSEMYKQSPDNINVEYVLLDALFALGKDENDFEWSKKPKIIRITEAVEICYIKLKNRRKRIGIYDLYSAVIIKGYLPFNVQELYEAVKSDGRFDIISEEYFYETMIKIAKGK